MNRYYMLIISLVLLIIFFFGSFYPINAVNGVSIIAANDFCWYKPGLSFSIIPFNGICDQIMQLAFLFYGSGAIGITLLFSGTFNKMKILLFCPAILLSVFIYHAYFTLEDLLFEIIL